MGTVLAITTLTHSNAGYFQARLPWHLGLVQLRCGPTVMVHLHAAVTTAPVPVRVIARLDRSGQGVLLGLPATSNDTFEGDAMMQEMGCDPRSRRILVTDGESESGLALVQALLTAGAAKVWVGHSGCLESVALPAAAPQVECVPLDLKGMDAAQALAQTIGAEVDIVIHNHDVQLGNAGGASLAAATTEMEINYFGLLRLAQAFVPLLRQRARQIPACAWVNLLSLAALSGYAANSTYCASKAAAHSFTHGLRAQLQAEGVRVISVFAGPLGAAELSDAIVLALRDGLEDVYPGEVAQSWLQGLRDDPKVWERELAAATRSS